MDSNIVAQRLERPLRTRSRCPGMSLIFPTLVCGYVPVFALVAPSEVVTLVDKCSPGFCMATLVNIAERHRVSGIIREQGYRRHTRRHFD